MKSLSAGILGLLLLLTAQARAEDSAQNLAKMYYGIAVTIAENRLADHVCDTDSSRPSLIDALSKAIRLDPSYLDRAKTSEPLNRAMGSDLAFRMTLNLISKESVKTVTKGLEGVVIYSSGEGIMPSATYALNSEGHLEVVTPYFDEKNEQIEYKKIMGTWSVSLNKSSEIELKLTFGGYTLDYVLHEFRLFGEGIVVFDILSGVGERHLWNFPSECEA